MKEFLKLSMEGFDMGFASEHCYDFLKAKNVNAQTHFPILPTASDWHQSNSQPNDMKVVVVRAMRAEARLSQSVAFRIPFHSEHLHSSV